MKFHAKKWLARWSRGTAGAAAGNDSSRAEVCVVVDEGPGAEEVGEGVGEEDCEEDPPRSVDELLVMLPLLPPLSSLIVSGTGSNVMIMPPSSAALLAAFLAAAFFARAAVACVSSRWRMSKSERYPEQWRRDLIHWLQTGRVSSHWGTMPWSTGASQKATARAYSRKETLRGAGSNCTAPLFSWPYMSYSP